MRADNAASVLTPDHEPTVSEPAVLKPTGSGEAFEIPDALWSWFGKLDAPGRAEIA